MADCPRLKTQDSRLYKVQSTMYYEGFLIAHETLRTTLDSLLYKVLSTMY